MPQPELNKKLSKLELQIMEVLWNRGALCVRDIQESFPPKSRLAYTTVQTMLYRLEAKQAVRRTRKIGNAHIFEAVVSRGATQSKLVDELLGLFGGRAQPLMAHLIEAGKLSLDEVEEARRELKKLAKKE